MGDRAEGSSFLDVDGRGECFGAGHGAEAGRDPEQVYKTGWGQGKGYQTGQGQGKGYQTGQGQGKGCQTGRGQEKGYQTGRGQGKGGIRPGGGRVPMTFAEL